MSDEDDERMERFFEAMKHHADRHEADVLSAAEASLSQVSTTDCPPPLTWHPFYRGKTFLIDWLNGASSLPEWTIKIPVPRRITYASISEDIGPSLASMDVLIMTKQRAWGPAPWTGRPFHYEWYVGTDNLGRRIAGESRIVYH